MQQVELRRLKPASIGMWLRQGWTDFTEASFISIVYAAVYCMIGAAAAIWLLSNGQIVVFFALAGGFMLVSPILVTGYYRVVERLREGGSPIFDDIVAGFGKNPRSFLIIGLVVAFVYLIWVTDAVLVYGLFFSDSPLVLSELASDPGVRGNLTAFVLFAGAMGGVLAFIIFTVTVFSVPDAFHRRANFVTAISTSVRGVLRNLDVMLLWAGVIAVLGFGTLLVALPLIIVVFPILGYASYAAYLDLIGELPEESARAQQG